MSRYTIAIPTYNNAASVEQAIESALRQQYQSSDFDILVVNNASTDTTKEVLQKYADNPQITVVENAETVSLFENHNVCFRHAKGDYVVFCHADDRLLPDALSKFDTALCRYGFPAHVVCFGRSYYRDFYRSYTKAVPLNTMLAGRDVLLAFQSGGLCPSGACYSKGAFLEIGGFLPMLSNKTPSDWSTMLLFGLQGGEFLMTDRLIVNRQAASTATETKESDIYRYRQEAFQTLQESMGESQITSLYKSFGSFDALSLELIQLFSESTDDIRLKWRLKLKFLFKNPGYLLKCIASRHRLTMLLK